jgi:hypothetical protein
MRAALRAAGDWPDTNSAHTQAQRLALVRLMQFRSPAARTVSDRHLRQLARDFLLAGWSARELLHALDYQPDGTPHPYAYHASDLRVPAGWLNHRWQFWRTADGTPLPGYRQAKQQTARGPRPAATQTNPRRDANPAASTGSALNDVTRDRTLRAQVRADRLARQAADRDRQLQAQAPAPARPAAPNHSAIIRARALARARQEHAARTTPPSEPRTQ